MANPFDSPNLREALAGTQQKIGAAMQGTFDNLRNGPPTSVSGLPFGTQNALANANIFEPGSFGAQNYAANATSPQAPVRGAAPTPGSVPGLSMAPSPMPNVFAPPGQSPVPMQAAVGLNQVGQLGQMAQWQDSLRDAGVNLDPFSQSPGDFHQSLTAAQGIYNNVFAPPGQAPGVQPGSSPGLPQGVPVSTYAPDDLRARAIAAQGKSVTGIGGAQVSAAPNKIGGTGFTLTQDPNTVPGAPGYVPRAAQPAQAQTPGSAPAGGQTPYQKNLAAAQAQQPGSGFTAPDGSMFLRDPRGRLQAAGSNPDLTAQAKGKEALATEEAKKTVEDAHKLLNEVGDSAETSRVQSGAISRITDLYNKGATTGFAQPLLTQAASALSRVTGKQVNIANQQQLEKEMGNLMLETSRSLMKGGGSVSNFERELVLKATANPSLTPQANMQILGVLNQIAQRNLALEKERVRLDDLGVPANQIAKEVRRMRDETPINTDALHAFVPPGEAQTVGKYKVTVSK